MYEAPLKNSLQSAWTDKQKDEAHEDRMNSQQESRTQGSLVWGELKHKEQFKGIKVIKEAKSQTK